MTKRWKQNVGMSCFSSSIQLEIHTIPWYFFYNFHYASISRYFVLLLCNILSEVLSFAVDAVHSLACAKRETSNKNKRKKMKKKKKEKNKGRMKRKKDKDNEKKKKKTKKKKKKK